MLGLSSLHARAREEGHYTWSAHVHFWVGVLKEPVLITYTYIPKWRRTNGQNDF